MASNRLPPMSTSTPAHAADLPGAEATPEVVVMAYHERTKHHFHRYAAALGTMDWATQPDPFRCYAGADLIRLPLPEAGRPLPIGSSMQLRPCHRCHSRWNRSRSFSATRSR